MSKDPEAIFQAHLMNDPATLGSQTRNDKDRMDEPETGESVWRKSYGYFFR